MHLVRCLTLLSVLGYIKCEFPTIEIDNSNEAEDEDEKVVIITALFTKINWMMMEMEEMTKNINNINERLKDDLNTNLQILKADIRETIKSDVMEMQQQLFKKIDVLENLIKKSSQDIESSNATVNKISQIQPLTQIENWLVILRRQDGSVDFNRNWWDYKNGFGNPNGEYFIGLEKLHAITTNGEQQELLIVLKDFDNNTRYIIYDDFVVGNEIEKFELIKLGDFSGDAGDSLSLHLNSPFSTKDQFNGNSEYEYCARSLKSGWWFTDLCAWAHLTAPYLHQPNTYGGIKWYSWHGSIYSLKFVEMMVRPKSY